MNFKKMFKKESDENGGKIKKVNLVALFGFALIICGALLFVGIATSREGKVEIISESALKEIIKTSELNVIEYTYSSTVTVKDKKTEKYHVAYNGTVKAGFDFDKMDIKHEESKKEIIIIIPDIKITSVNIDEKSLDYIFIKEKYDTEKTFQEAFNASEKDLLEKAKSNKMIFEMARESAIESVEALMKPYEDSLPQDYKIICECVNKEK